MIRKLKFYAIGLIPGIILVIFILNKKGATCSGYLPNGRVIAETVSKDFQYSPEFKTEMDRLQIVEDTLRKSIISNGKIDFDKSDTHRKPCPSYIMTSPSESAKYEIHFEKCEKAVTFTKLIEIK